MNYLRISLLVGLLVSVCTPAHAENKPFFVEHSGHRIEPQHVLPHGLTLKDHEVSCSFESFFPVGGNVSLNNGRLELMSDFRFSTTGGLTTGGAIVGNNNALILPYQRMPFSLPANTEFAGALRSQVIPVSRQLGAVAFLASDEGDLSWPALIAGSFDAGASALQTYHYVDQALVPQRAIPFKSGIRSLSVKPGTQEGVLGTEAHSDGTLHHFSVAPGTGEVTTTPILPSSPHEVSALAWHPTRPCFLAGFVSRTDQLAFYMQREDGFDQRMSLSITDNQAARVYSIAWSPDGNYVVFGCSHNASFKQLHVYRLESQSLLHVASAAVPAHVTAVAFKPGSGEMRKEILVGCTGGSGNKLLMYALDNETDTLSLVGGYSVNNDVYDLSWNPDHNLLALTTALESGRGEVTVYQMHDDNLSRVISKLYTSRQFGAVWNDNEQLLVTIDSHKNMVLTDVEAGLVLENLAVVANGPVHVAGTTAIKGTVAIHGNGHELHAMIADPYVIEPSSQLYIDGLFIVTHNEHTSIAGYDDSSVVLRNVSLYPEKELRSRVPLHWYGVCRIMHTLDADSTLTDNTVIELLDESTLRGSLVVEGNVVIRGNGHRLDVSAAALQVNAGGRVTFEDIRLEGVQADSFFVSTGGDASWVFRDTNMSLSGDVADLNGTVTFDGDCVVRDENNVYEVHDLHYSDSHDSLVAVLSQYSNVVIPTPGVEASGVESPTVDTPTASQIKPITIKQPLVSLLNDVSLSPKRPWRITQDVVVDGGGSIIDCPLTTQPVFSIDPGVSLTFKNVIIRNFVPSHIKQQDGSSVTFASGTALHLGGSAKLNQSFIFSGVVAVSGSDHTLTVGEGSAWRIGAESTLKLERTRIAGLTSSFFQMVAPSSILSMSDCSFRLGNDVSFSQGRFVVSGDCRITGPYRFEYQSSTASNIAAHSTLHLEDGVLFRYGPRGSTRDDLIRFDDVSSALKIKDATFECLSSGFVALKGVLELVGRAGLVGAGHGLVWGDAEHPELFKVVCHSGAVLDIGGSVFFNNGQNKIN